MSRFTPMYDGQGHWVMSVPVVNEAMAEALQDTRWLLSRHRDLLDAGKLRLPDRANHFGDGGHPAVLVSVPEVVKGTEVAWVDEQIAKLVWLLNLRHGLTTIESCQGGPGQGSYLAFRRRRDCDRFLSLAGDSLRGESRSRWGRDVWFGHSQLARITQTVEDTTP